MSNKSRVIRKAPWSRLTYKINGLAMAVHNELGPGHRERDYHRAPVALFRNFGRWRLEHRRLLPPKSVQACQRQPAPSAPAHPHPSAAPSASPPPSAAPSVAPPPKIDHIGIVVRDIQAALQVYQDALGLPLQEIAAVPDQKVEVAFLPLGESNIELVQPTSDDTGVAKFLARRGEGIHHVCIEVKNIEMALARLKAHHVQLIDEVPRRGVHGRVAFVHPKAMHGVLIELVEHDS